MATHSGILAWRIPGTEELGWATVYGVAQSRTRPKRLSSSPATTVSISADSASDRMNAYTEIFACQLFYTGILFLYVLHNYCDA